MHKYYTYTKYKESGDSLCGALDLGVLCCCFCPPILHPKPPSCPISTFTVAVPGSGICRQVHSESTEPWTFGNFWTFVSLDIYGGGSGAVIFAAETRLSSSRSDIALARTTMSIHIHLRALFSMKEIKTLLKWINTPKKMLPQEPGEWSERMSVRDGVIITYGTRRYSA